MKPVSRAEYIAMEAKHMTEAVLQKRVRDLALTYGWKFQHPYDSRRSDPGWPDCAIGRTGRLIVRELKTQKGRVSPDQREWLAILKSCGIDAGIWRPSDLLDGTITRELQ